MPAISPYGKAPDCGPLQLPPLTNIVARSSADAVAEEVNTTGAYIHVIARDRTPQGDGSAIRQQLRKLNERKTPTPATMVGTGFHRLYNHERWADASGLVFTPDSVSLLSYKGSMGSYRLWCLPPLSAADHAAQARTIQHAFNRLGGTTSLLHPTQAKKLDLTEDVVRAKKKY